MHALDWSIATNDGYLIRQVSQASCKTCERYLKRFDSLRVRGEVLTGGRISLLDASDVTDEYRTNADLVIRIKTDQEPSRIADSTGRSVSTEKGGVETSLLDLDWSASGWHVREVFAA